MYQDDVRTDGQTVEACVRVRVWMTRDYKVERP